GSIEQDADVVMFIYREEKVKKDTERKGRADIIVAKQRNGPTGTVELMFWDKFTKFNNLDTVHSYDEAIPAGQ
ncbi:MAG TPA: DnaB-like helicase C-terminal domain-containing protein, partial [Spirochaetota bacterium]|nr:DnaB-like helicase C-terminal domain-containing protein [Spirochaetota bacterium]